MISRMIKTLNPIATSPTPKARSFAALMELYELNFILLRRLMPDLVSLAGMQHYCGSAGGLLLYVEVLEQDRFTTVLRMFYRLPSFEAVGQVSEAPDMNVRIYHDARVAESVSGRLHGRDCVAQGRTGERCLDVRWRLNRFLYKWLRFLLHRQYQKSTNNSSSEIL